MNNFFESVQVPKIIQEICAVDYDPAMGEMPCIYVWANPPRKLIAEFQSIQLARQAALAGVVRASNNIKRLAFLPAVQAAYIRRVNKDVNAVNVRMSKWLSEIWSQGPEESHVSPQQVAQSQSDILAQDGKFWAWIIEQTAGKILAHNNREILEKN